MDINWANIFGWFILGITMGAGPCLGHSVMITLPYISMVRDSPMQGFKDMLAFSAARAGVYTILGFLSGLMGGAFAEILGDGRILIMVQTLLGLLLIGLAAVVLLGGNSFFCKKFHGFFIARPGRAMALAGVCTSLTPCPVLIGLFVYSMSAGSWTYGLAVGGLFGLGSALTPLLLAGPLFAWLKQRFRSPKIQGVFRYAGGFILFGYGLFVLTGIL